MDPQDWPLQLLQQLLDGEDGVGLLKALALCLSVSSFGQLALFPLPTPPELAFQLAR